MRFWVQIWCVYFEVHHVACLGLTNQRWPYGFGPASSNKAFWWTGDKKSRSFISHPIAHLCIVRTIWGRNETCLCHRHKATSESCRDTLLPSTFNVQIISNQIHASWRQFSFQLLFAICSPNARARRNAQIKTKPNSSSSLLHLGTAAALGDVSVYFKVRTCMLQQGRDSRFRHNHRHFVLCQSQTMTWKIGLFLPQTDWLLDWCTATWREEFSLWNHYKLFKRKRFGEMNCSLANKCSKDC